MFKRMWRSVAPSPLASIRFEREGSALPGAARRAWRARRSVPSIAVAVVVLILLASVWQPHLGALSQGSHQPRVPSLSPRGAAPRPASTWLAAGPSGAVGQNTSSATYDEQIGATFTGNFTYLAYNVTALGQTDVDGYGPGYLLNGLTPEGYFYQVGISYHWPTDPGSFPGFGFGYQVFGPDDTPVYPAAGGSGLVNFSGTVNSGDIVLLSLTFTGPTVQMLAQDWNTGAVAETNYSSFGSSSFVGSPSSPSDFRGYFTGLMTEWYHVAPYSGNEGAVTYTNNAVALTSAWMWIDEFDTSSAGAGPSLFHNETLTTFANDQQIYPFYADGATMYISAHQFITGLPAAASPSKVTLTPSTEETPAPTFSANYTLSGHAQTVSIAAGATVLEADPGTSIKISIIPGSIPSERWVFNGTSGTVVTVTAGANATYVLYHLVRETVEYQVATGGQAFPASSAPALRYEVPPPLASATAAPVVVKQAIGTTPVVIYAILGSDASIDGTISGSAGEQWVANTQDWNITEAGLIPLPIIFYQQYDVSISYSVIGGGTPSNSPEFTAASLGRLVSIPISSVATAGWFDAGSAYSFTGLINGSTGVERWVDSGGPGSAPSVISSSGEAFSTVYTPQYYDRLSVNDAAGGAVSGSSGWFDLGSSFTASASANQGWHFEGWNGSGVGAYAGTSPSVDVVVAGPFNESATFYVQLVITADAGTDIAFSYPSQSGTVQAGTTKTLDVPASNVTLRATPSFFFYSFASWQGAGIANPKDHSLVIGVDSPTAVTGKSTYNSAGVLVLLALSAAVVLNLLAVSLWIRGRRRKEKLGTYSG
jgi:Divergent InlB B-repeat domain